MSSVENTSPKRKKIWVFALVGLLALLLVAYLVGTSAAFIRGFVLPKVAKSLDSEIRVADLSISPFSSVRLKGVELTPKGGETLLKVAEVHVRYGLIDILRGNLRMDELTVVRPEVTVVESADGKSGNLQTLLKAVSAGAKPSASKAPSSPPRILARNIRIDDASIRHQKALLKGGWDVAEAKGLNLSVDQVSNGGSGKAVLKSRLGYATGDAGRLEADLSGNFDFALTADLQPASARGKATADVISAAGSFKDVQSLGTDVDVNFSGTELKPLQVSFRQAAQALGKLSVSGPLHLAKKEANLDYELSGIDRRVLALVGGALGIDFGTTTIRGKGRVDMAQGGAVFGSEGRIQADQVALLIQGTRAPVLDGGVDYRVTVRQSEENALIDRLDVQVRQAGRELLKGGLDRPMTLAWGKSKGGFRDSVFNLSVNDLRLDDWKAFLGTNAPSGSLNAEVKASSEQGGRTLAYVIKGRGSDLSTMLDGKRADQLAIDFSGRGNLVDMRAHKLEDFSASASQAGRKLADLRATGTLNQETMEGGAQVNAEVQLPNVVKLLPSAGLDASSGLLKLAAQAGIKPGSTNITANVLVSDFNGTAAGVAFKGYQVKADIAADLSGASLNLSQATLEAKTADKPGGTVHLEGRYDMSRRSGTMKFKTEGLNESALGPVVAAALAPRRLQSLSIDGSGNVEFSGDSDLKAGMSVQLGKLQITTPGQPVVAPVSLSVALDAVQKGTVIEISRFIAGLGPTQRARNDLSVSGRIDLSTNPPAPGTLSIRSDGLDFTPLYDMWFGTAAAAAPAPDKSPVAPVRDALAEPDPIRLPVQKLNVDLNLAQVFLREIAIRDWTTKVSIDSGQVLVDPFSLTLNGAPVSARVAANLNVPGFAYDVALDTQQIPIAPLNDSLNPADRGRLSGTVKALAKVKGAGVTGAGFQRNLAGMFDVGTTNLNLSLDRAKMPALKSVINVIVGVPDLVRNPLAGVTGLLGNLLGNRSSPTGGNNSGSRGWVDEITASPISVVSAKGTLGGGQVSLENAHVRSTAFLADARGSVQFAPTLTNSVLQIPLDVALRKELAQKAGLISRGTNEPVALTAVSTNVVYAKLDPFVSLKGTLGVPKPDINYLVLGKMVTKAAGGIGGNTVKAGADAIGNVLGGLLGKPAPAASTNAAPANPNPVDALRGLFPGKKKP